MPYPSEHALRIKDPGAFVQKTFRRKNIAPGIDIIVGALKSDPKAFVAQAYRFKKEKFTFEEAKEWAKEHDLKPILSEEAGKTDEMEEEMESCPEEECGECEMKDKCGEKKDKCGEKKDKNCKKSDSVNRMDFSELVQAPSSTYLYTPASKTKEGYLKGRAVMTNVGVFSYRMKDGSVRMELRPPEEVFNTDSLKTLELQPMTNNHPVGELVDAQNIKKYQVGSLGSEIFTDAYHVSLPYMITDPEAIADIQNGKRALSCGYKADIEDKSGVWMGVKYDAVQRNIRYNHVALVDVARAGDAAVLRMDSDAVSIASSTINSQGENMNMKVIHIDGIEYQAEADVIKAYNSVKQDADNSRKELEELKNSNSKLLADFDTAKDKLDAAEKKIAALEAVKADASAIKEAVKVRVGLTAIAKDCEAVVTDAMDDEEIKKAVILKVFPSTKLDGKDSVYISARFDSAVDILAERKASASSADAAAQKNADVLLGDKKVDGAGKEENYQTRRDSYKEELKQSWKNYKGGK